MMQVVIGDKKTDVEVLPNDLFMVHGKEEVLDMVSLGEGKYSVIKNHKTYMLEVLAIDREKKTLQLKINNKVQEIKVKDHYDLLAESLGMSSGANKKIKELKAPMPGLVLEVLAEKKQSMDKGSTLLILEAMKMENIIKSPEEVVVDTIHVNAGDSVEKNQVLITFV